MKIIYTMSIAWMLLLIHACNDDNKGASPSDITNVRAEAREGAIMLRWDNPSDENFLFVQVQYLAPGKEELTKKNVSSYADSLLIDNLLNKDGEYNFTLRTVSETGVFSTNKLEINCTALRKPPVITEYSEKIELSVNDLTANASDPSQGELIHLIDGDLGTFYHTNWHETIPFPHWIQFNLTTPVQAVKIITWNRKDYNSGNADQVSVLGSNDGIEWEEMGYISSGSIPTAGSARYESPVFSIEGKTFTKIRYNVIRGMNDNTWFNIAEIELQKAWYVIEDPEK